MRKHLSLLLVASFFFMKPSIQASSVNDDRDGSAAVAPGVSHSLFDERGRLTDQRPADVYPLVTEGNEGDRTYKYNAFSTLPHLIRVEIMECLQNEPQGQLSLMQVSSGFRKLVVAMPGRNDLTVNTSNALKKHLMMVLIGGQSGDVDLFMKDQKATFDKLTLAQLQDTYASRYYNGTLSPTTKHGKTYRSIGPGNIEGKELSLANKGLRLVPLNFSEAETLTELDLTQNQLCVAPDLSRQTALEKLILSYNQLRAAPDLSKHTALKVLYLNNNQLTVAPVMTTLRMLKDLYLKDNPLRSAPDLSQQTALQWLYLDGSLCGDETLLSTLRNLNRPRAEEDKMSVFACSKNGTGADVYKKVSLN